MGSNVSMWLGAPVWKTRMTDLALGFAVAARPRDGNPIDRKLEKPTCITERRFQPGSEGCFMGNSLVQAKPCRRTDRGVFWQEKCSTVTGLKKPESMRDCLLYR